MKDPAALKELRELFATPRSTMLEFGDVFERVRTISVHNYQSIAFGNPFQLIVHIKQQLSTSVEEDKANASNFEIIKHREEEVPSTFIQVFTSH